MSKLLDQRYIKRIELQKENKRALRSWYFFSYITLNYISKKLVYCSHDHILQEPSYMKYLKWYISNNTASRN